MGNGFTGVCQHLAPVVSAEALCIVPHPTHTNDLIVTYPVNKPRTKIHLKKQKKKLEKEKQKDKGENHHCHPTSISFKGFSLFSKARTDQIRLFWDVLQKNLC